MSCVKPFPHVSQQDVQYCFLSLSRGFHINVDVLIRGAIREIKVISLIFTFTLSSFILILMCRLPVLSLWMDVYMFNINVIDLML